MNGLDYSETTRGAYFNEGELRAANIGALEFSIFFLGNNKAMNEEEWSCSACTFANHPDLISCEICGTDRSDNHQASLSSQEQILKTAGLSVSSAPFIPNDSPSQQPEADKNDFSNSSAPSVPLASATIPKEALPQQEADKKALSVSSSPFDPSWRQKLGRSPALTNSATTSTSTSTNQQGSLSARGNAAAMMPGVHHRPMNMMQGYGMIPQPVSMPVHGMPMVGVPGQVTYPSTTILLIVISVAMHPLLHSNTPPTDPPSTTHVSSDRWDMYTL